MLVQFTLKNVLSFKKEILFDLSAVHAYKEHCYNLIDIGVKEKFLRVVAIYGANASGKSNFYIAMKCFRRIIAESFNNVDDNKQNAIERYFIPFKFEKEEENTQYEIVTILNGYEYKYGFEFNSERVVNEWLYRKKTETNRNTIIFERTEERIELGPSVREECANYKNQIPKETLALSFFNKLKLEIDIFREVFSSIMDISVTTADLYEDRALLKKLLPGMIDLEKEKLLNFLSAIDSGIKNIVYTSEEKTIKFFTIHEGEDGKEYYLPLFHESEGTIRSIFIFIHAMAAVNNNSVLFVDELNVKLHPLLLKFIIDLFYENDSCGQLIYTTHDTTLMDKKFFRRDQIWFVQKDQYGYSDLMSLADFKVRSDASFEKDYLAGVYGGIPLIKEFSLKEGE